MDIRFDGRVAIVTGAGRGLGRSHVLGLAARGAKVAIVDFDPSTDGAPPAASAVAAEIGAQGGEAIAIGANVADAASVQTMIEQVLARWGRVDILVNNAGILRDKSFAKMELADFRLVLEVHVMGTVNCTKAVWERMREQKYGRIVLTASSSGLYGNFGQSNYGTAKAAMVGLMNVLHLEGEKYDIRVNALLPTAATQMTEGLFPEAVARLATPESITPGLLFLVSENAPSRVMLCAGAGTFARTLITETVGVHFPEADRTPEAIAAAFDRISDPTGATGVATAFAQTEKLVALARS
ncbi:MAG TPA: SDR family NAD(P)-dependent oxidoreductase [Hypericibacter adhaerens]|jgi:NAD(P)-dependent dehydrogenase (short-subunit alcohol dehydrogenase family)|uniref:3-oxoacyl-ACP reductase n=1 Tax=Hypericibacter adhaerens TaxID=2602016 RepID=A0A5J6MU66_9PROT|nr:SDR family NAD(P)-dependent oxidoreductase [Hypericibacter adhaerens]QEX20707.1 3-oxoacyl-ACP reductase [Hypericibacter adhaerens]HWA42545.1 SDR family NAD(P)-dependent oxidoreductase [Hypericibacter adhaerens]